MLGFIKVPIIETTTGGLLSRYNAIILKDIVKGLGYMNYYRSGGFKDLRTNINSYENPVLVLREHFHITMWFIGTVSRAIEETLKAGFEIFGNPKFSVFL